jgi:hypothetical protein
LGNAIRIFQRIGNQYELAVTQLYLAWSGAVSAPQGRWLRQDALKYFRREGIDPECHERRECCLMANEIVHVKIT